MFDRRSDYVTSGRLFTQTSNRQVVGFSAAGSEDDLVLLRANQRRDFTSRTIDRRPRLLTKAVNTRRVPKRLHYRSRHRVRDPRSDGRRGAVIQVNSHKSCQLRCEIRHLRGSLPQRSIKSTNWCDSMRTLRGWLSQDATAQWARKFFGRTQYELQIGRASWRER